MMRYIYLSLIVVLTHTGCAPIIKVTSFGPISGTPTTGDIDVYTSVESIKKPYKEIALITVDDEGWGRSESELLDKLISKAKDIGADGVILLSQDKQSEGGVFVSGVFIQSNRRIVRGTAIMYEKHD